MEKYLLLLIVLFLIYFIYRIHKNNIKNNNNKNNNNSNNNNSNIHNSNNQSNNNKFTGGNILNSLGLKTNMVVIHNTNNYISTNNIVETADVTNISPPHKNIWEIRLFTNGYTIRNTLNRNSLLSNVSNSQKYEMIQINGENKFNIQLNDDSNKFVKLENNKLISSLEKTEFTIEPYRLGLFDINNNIITLYKNIVNNFNYNNFSTSFTLQFDKIYFSKNHKQPNSNILTNNTNIFNIYPVNHKEKFNYKKYDAINNLVSQDYSNVSDYIIGNNKYNFFIFDNNTLTQSITNYDKSQENNQWTIKYDHFEKNYTINNKSSNKSILYTLGNTFKIKNHKVESSNQINKYIKIENNNLKSTENVTEANIFSMYNIIESNYSNTNKIIFCDFKSNTFSLSNNLKNKNGSTFTSNYQKDSENKFTNRVLLIPTGMQTNSYLIKYLQNVKEDDEVNIYNDGQYLYLDNNQFLLSDTKKYNTIKNDDKYHFIFENYNFNKSIIEDTLNIEKVPNKLNNYYISYKKDDTIYYLSSSKFNGILVSDTIKTNNEFIIVPYKNDFRNSNTVNTKKYELNIKDEQLNKIYPEYDMTEIEDIMSNKKYSIYNKSNKYISINPSDKNATESNTNDINSQWYIIKANNIFKFYNAKNNIFLGENNVFNTSDTSDSSDKYIFNIDFILKK